MSRRRSPDLWPKWRAGGTETLRNHGVVFGTDGWRALIADGFTVERLQMVAQAFSDWLRMKARRGSKVLIGSDGRFGGERFAIVAGRVVAGNGFKPEVSATVVPTPAVSWLIPRKRYAAGLMITASHNPPAYTGVKVKPDFGGSPDETVMGPIAARLGRSRPKLGDTAAVKRVDFLNDYLKAACRFVDMRAVRKLKGTVVFDAMGGAQAGMMEKALKGARLKVVSIHDKVDPMSAGLASPEPVEKNLDGLKTAVRRARAVMGVATDGDGDRVGIVADGGRFVSPHLVFALLLKLMVEIRGETGAVIKTVSGSYIIERMARAYRRKVHETPVGFKYLCRLMLERDIVIGGEESGGVGFKGYIPERDGLVSGLLMLELLAKTGKTPRRLVRDLIREFGATAYARIDVRHTRAADSLKRMIASPPSRVGPERVARVNVRDGLKLIFPDDAWLLFRASGTEPLLRIYAESASVPRTRRILKAGAALAGVRR